MHKRMHLANRSALVTGAASGIGRAISVSLARRRCHLALVDIDPHGLQETAEQAALYGIQVSRYCLDIADPAAVAALPRQLLADHGALDLLINNAGVAVGGSFEQISETDFDWLFAINFHGLVRMTRAFLPALKASHDARIVNISSIFGLIAPAGQTAYAASKFAVRGFSEALRHELQGTQVAVTLVLPGGVATAIAAKARKPASVSEQEAAQELARFEKLLTMPPEIAGERIVQAIERRQSQVLVGSDAKIIALLARLAPVSYWKLLERLDSLF